MQFAFWAAIASVAISLSFLILRFFFEDIAKIFAADVHSVLIEAVVVLCLGWGVKKGNREASIALLIIFLANKLIMLLENASFSAIPITLVFFALYIRGVIGTFAYQKIIREKASTWHQGFAAARGLALASVLFVLMGIAYVATNGKAMAELQNSFAAGSMLSGCQQAVNAAKSKDQYKLKESPKEFCREVVMQIVAAEKHKQMQGLNEFSIGCTVSASIILANSARQPASNSQDTEFLFREYCSI